MNFFDRRAPWSQVRPGLGIDLGTASTVVWHPARGLLLDEASLIAFRGPVDHSAPVASGNEAATMVGRTPAAVSVVDPMRSGALTDLEVGRRLLVALVAKAKLPPQERVRPRVVFTVPVSSSSLERQALIEVASEAGFGSIRLLPAPVAAALGDGLDLHARESRLVVDVGAGISEIAAFGSGGVVGYRSTPIAGRSMTEAVITYLRAEYQLLVGEVIAQRLKEGLGSGSQCTIDVAGFDAASGRPRRVSITTEEIARAVSGPVDSIVDVLTSLLDQTLPAQALSDAMDAGVLVVGGAAQFCSLASKLEASLGIPVRLASTPRHCAARGAAAAVSDSWVLKEFSVR